MLPVPVCHGSFAVNGIIALWIICPPVRAPAFFSGKGAFQHGTTQKRKCAGQLADFLNARFQCLRTPHDTECVQQNTIHLHAYYAQLLPDQKVEKLEMLDKQKRQGSKLAFVGDGINDAPVLARADVGIAMGGLGSDAAIEAADVVLMTDEPSQLVEAIDVAKATKRIVMQNIVIALGIKSVFLVLGALGMAGMWEAVFGDVGVTIIAVLNAMRILKK